MMWLFFSLRKLFQPFRNLLGRGLLQTFRDFLSFNLSLKAKADWMESVFWRIRLSEEVLDAGFGLRVASLMNKVREDENF